MSAKRLFRPSRATVVAPARRPSPAGRPRALALVVATMLAATLSLGGGVAVSLAATSATCPENPPGCAGVYFDPDNNVGAGPNPFNATFTGVQNVALGHTMMGSLTDGSYNVASGFGALSRDTSGQDNVATGNSALFSNTTGSANLASGAAALFLNTTGNSNVASGIAALRSNTSGNGNVASGSNALQQNTTGDNNVASGENALFNNTTGSSNVALGFRAGNNVTFGSNNIHIANEGFSGESGKIHIGTKGKQNAAFIAGVSGTAIPGPTQEVVVNANGRLGTATRGQPAGVHHEQLSTLLLAELKRQDRELRRQGRELRKLRAQVLGRR